MSQVLLTLTDISKINDYIGKSFYYDPNTIDIVDLLNKLVYKFSISSDHKTNKYICTIKNKSSELVETSDEDIDLFKINGDAKMINYTYVWYNKDKKVSDSFRKIVFDLDHEYKTYEDTDKDNNFKYDFISKLLNKFCDSIKIYDHIINVNNLIFNNMEILKSDIDIDFDTGGYGLFKLYEMLFDEIYNKLILFRSYITLKQSRKYIILKQAFYIDSGYLYDSSTKKYVNNVATNIINLFYLE